MTASITVSVPQLQAALDRVLGTVQDKYGSTIDLGADMYYVVPPSSAYEVGVTPEPSTLTLGSLADDVELVEELASQGDSLDRPDLIIWHDLTHLVGVLQRLAALDLP